MQQQVGLGPTLLLMTTKALAYLFLFLTLLNIPVYLFYYSGNVSLSDNEQQSAIKFQNYFAMVSLGNIGQN